MDHRVFNLTEEDHVITIASAGCNVLDYIIEGAHVTAVDFNSCQIALTELKKVCIMYESYDTFFDIFSMSNMELLRVVYPKTLRPHLSPASAEFWDTGIHTIKSFMYSGTSGNMSYILFRVLFPLFGLGFVRDELNKGVTSEELTKKIMAKGYSIRGLAWLLDNIRPLATPIPAKGHPNRGCPADVADAIVFYVDLGWSDGMSAALVKHTADGRTIEQRRLPGWLTEAP